MRMRGVVNALQQSTCLTTPPPPVVVNRLGRNTSEWPLKQLRSMKPVSKSLQSRFIGP